MPESFSPDRRDQSSLEYWLATEFTENYEELYQVLNHMGLLDILPKSGERGIIGIDKKEYPIPSQEAIKDEIRRNREIYEPKIAQGFTQIQLTPFAVPLGSLISLLERQLKEHYKRDKLFATRENKDDPDEPLKLNENGPIWAWSKWRGSDQDGSCVYYPSSFDQDKPSGHTKAEILRAQNNADSPLAGWDAFLVEPDMNIPREGKGKTKSKRKQLEAGKTPTEYLRLLQIEPQYRNEQGLTNEDWLIIFITHLEQTNQVIDDYLGKGSSCYLTGSFKPSSGELGGGSWNRDFRQAYLGTVAANCRSSNIGLRSAVRLRQKLVFEPRF